MLKICPSRYLNHLPHQQTKNPFGLNHISLESEYWGNYEQTVQVLLIKGTRRVGVIGYSGLGYTF